MRNIEKLISPLVASQFPSFYQEEGDQFIAFVKAYYEWMEQSGNVLNKVRSLGDYRDIDTTPDEFIVYFKEKYLKNIQFDTASNKTLLVKNSLDLYRSKGTERSIDLFFKLVYGTNADVRYPAENIFRLSDGIYEVPLYLEISYSKYNIDYVGKQVIGALSGATGFVERYIRRRTDRGYVNLLYITNINGAFLNGEVIGLNINNTPVFDSTKRAKMIGSVNRVEIIDKGVEFAVGDIVSFSGSERGNGGLARVSSVGSATGIIDFIFVDGGYGYTLDAQSLISEKVVSLSNVVAGANSYQYFRLFEQMVEPVINVAFTSATANLAVGETVYRYNGGSLVAAGKILDLNQTTANGTITISHVNGSFTNTATYYTTSNTISFYANTIEDRTIGGKVMGIPTTYNISISNPSESLQVGSKVYQKNTATGVIYARGTISDTVDNTNITVINSRGAFKNSLTSTDLMYVEGSNTAFANVELIDLTVGLYNIKKYVNTVKYSAANNNKMLDTPYIYQYNSSGNVSAKGVVLTSSFTANTGNVTFIPISGYFLSTKKVYTQGNTAEAYVISYATSNSGGDYIASPHSRFVTQTTNTASIPYNIGYGSGASFKVATIGDTEVIFIGTDLIGANNVGTLDYDRKILTVASNTGFAIGDPVYQTVNKIAFNPNTSVNATTGFITIPSANSKFNVGDNIKYEVAAGNTEINMMISNNYYHVRFANTTGLILSYPYRKTDYLNVVNFPPSGVSPGFANGAVSEIGHYLYKLVYGTVFEVTSTQVKIQDRVNYFSVTGGTANTTTSANSNLIKYGATTTNTAISAVGVYPTIVQANQAYASLSIRAPAYGFPKNAQGDLADTIYSCLTFGRFEIGVIGALKGIDPGSEYNVNPYILAYQPYISAFDRNDFLITIDTSTSTFVVGEKINQVQANLIYYDLQVPSGVYSNVYSEVTRSFDSQMDVNGTTEFILVPSNTVTFNSNTNVSTADKTITVAGNPFVVNDYIRYYTATGNTVISGLANNTLYYVSFANTSTISLSSTLGGTNLAITSATTGETGHYLKNYANPYANNDRVIYTTLAGNTIIGGLANNTPYYVVYSNAVGMALASTVGGANINITANSTGGEQQYFATIPGYLPNDKVYQGSSNATVQSVYITGGNQFVRVSGNTGPLATNQILYSYSNPYVNSTVSAVTFVSLTSTAKGIIKAGSNTSVLKVKRLSFENTFKEGVNVIGDVSGATANVMGVAPDFNELYPIGLNADIQANVVTANGQVTSLQVVDSGFGYVNSEIIQFNSADMSRSGSIKVILDGNGKGKGYYKSSKGFISEDMYIHDGDYYQEYSYEILSKMSFDKYADMFKKVMHVAGTKFFGSAQVEEEGNLPLTLIGIGNGTEVAFDAHDDVDSPSERIKMNIEKSYRAFDPLANVNQESEFITITANPFVNNDLVLYYTDTGNTVLQGLSNNSLYYVVQSNSSGVKLSVTLGGTPVDANNASSVSERGHWLRSYINPFANGDYVYYTTATGNTAVTGLANGAHYYVTNTNPLSLQLSSSNTGLPIINITASGSSQVGHFLSKIVEETI
jgi:hypothetical protein